MLSITSGAPPLKEDLEQQHNLASSNPEKLAEMKILFKEIRGVGSNDIEALELK